MNDIQHYISPDDELHIYSPLEHYQVRLTGAGVLDLIAENERLRAALTSFVNQDWREVHCGNTEKTYRGPVIGQSQLDRARAALSPTTPEQE